jgi:16S rRNA (adenine1518-N6/adenine1519-N6)-dimethyltransferase
MKHVARKRFGQHFLVDPGVISDIVQCIEPKRFDRMVEIGPGLAAITAPLSQALERLCVIELDRDLASKLRAKPSLKVVESDVLRVNFTELAQQLGGSPIRVVGNLPYNISTPILFHLLDHVDVIEDQHFMLQKEVVDRMTAKVNSSEYGRLSVMLQWRYDMEKVLDVGVDAFDPPPRVLSAVVRMRPKPHPTVLNVDTLSTLVQVAFSQRRKILRHTLEPWLASQGWEGEFDFQQRAQEVSLEHFEALALAVGEIKESSSPFIG